MYAQTRGTTTSKGFAAVYNNPQGFFPKAVREEYAAAEKQSLSHVRQIEMIRLVDDAIFANHLSVTRGVKFTFAFECSRSTGRQMLRHVVDFYWEEMSQRYVKLLNPGWLTKVDERLKEFEPPIYNSDWQDRWFAELSELMEGPFVLPASWSDMARYEQIAWMRVRAAEVGQYLAEIASGIAAEDARENLPNCTKTQMIATAGFEAIKTFLGKRLCTRAQEPVREIAKAMRKQIVSHHPWMGKHLTVHCLPHRICPEARPDDCALLLENGGNVLRKAQAQDAITAYTKEYRVCPALPSVN